MGKNCAQGLGYSRPRAQFFPTQTSCLVNNIIIFFGDVLFFEVGKQFIGIIWFKVSSSG